MDYTKLRRQWENDIRNPPLWTAEHSLICGSSGHQNTKSTPLLPASPAPWRSQLLKDLTRLGQKELGLRTFAVPIPAGIEDEKLAGSVQAIAQHFGVGPMLVEMRGNGLEPIAHVHVL